MAKQIKVKYHMMFLFPQNPIVDDQYVWVVGVLKPKSHLHYIYSRSDGRTGMARAASCEQNQMWQGLLFEHLSNIS